MRIFEFLNYRDYLIERLGAEGSRTGLRKKLAQSIPVHTTFVSQVLKGRVEFSLEQAEPINEFLGHTEEEGEYFILLLLKERAGTQKLRQRFEQKIHAMQEHRLNIKNRIQAKEEISHKDRERFYSSYIYGAIHVLTAIPKFQTEQSLAEALKLSRVRIREILDFMVKLGVLQEENGKFKSGSQHIHLGNESELILKHHANWRLHTLSNLQFLSKEDVHYSACLSLSEKDAFRVKEVLMQSLKSNIDIISESEEEVAYVMSFDFYKLLS